MSAPSEVRPIDDTTSIDIYTLAVDIALAAAAATMRLTMSEPHGPSATGDARMLLRSTRTEGEAMKLLLLLNDC